MRTSIVFNQNETSKVNFFEVLQSQDNLQYTLNCDWNLVKTYVTWPSNNTPSFVSNLITAEGPYNEDAMAAVLESHEWLVMPEVDPLNQPTNSI